MSALSDSFRRSNKESKDLALIQSMIVDPAKIGYNSNAIKILALYLIMCNVFSNFDHGALPAALVEIKDELAFDKATMGSLGSYVYFGFVIGSTVNGAFFLNHLSYKTILIISFVLNGVGALLFCLVKDYYCLAFARFLSGFG